MKNYKIRNRNPKINYITEEPSAELRIKQNQSARGRFFLTDFQLRVLEETLKIPLGEVRSYRWIATRVGCPKAVRAVGSALNKNPYPILIPCHRVVKSDGDTGGYARGKQVKRQLLAFEKRLKNIFCLNHKKEVLS
jgi:O-6-methylguanine DNA methyltransferase